MCSGVPEFAAYFRFGIPEVRAKPGSVDQTLAFPALPEIRIFVNDAQCPRAPIQESRVKDNWLTDELGAVMVVASIAITAACSTTGARRRKPVRPNFRKHITCV